MKTAKGDGDTRQLTVRLPRELYATAEQLARSRQVSLNGLVRQLLDQLARAERERELEQAYGVLGTEGADVDPFFEAQAEVARRG